MSDSENDRIRLAHADEDRRHGPASETSLATGQPATVAVAEALAATSDEESAPSVTAQRPLYSYLDTDALDSLVRNTPESTQLHVEFEIGETTILVSSDGTVVVR